MSWIFAQRQGMTTDETDLEEAGVPEQAVKALTAAQQQAAEAGYPLVLVQDGFLVRIDHTGTTVLKKMPARMKVSIRTWNRIHEPSPTPAADVRGAQRIGQDDRQE
jgi:hypothetical protein